MSANQYVRREAADGVRMPWTRKYAACTWLIKRESLFKASSVSDS